MIISVPKIITFLRLLPEKFTLNNFDRPYAYIIIWTQLSVTGWPSCTYTCTHIKIHVTRSVPMTLMVNVTSIYRLPTSNNVFNLLIMNVSRIRNTDILTC